MTVPVMLWAMGDISMSIPQPNDDDSIPQPDVDDSIPQPDVDDSIPQPDVDDDSMFDDNKDQVLENQRCDEFLLKTCSCSKVNRKPCSSLCTVQHYTDLRAQASYVNSLIWWSWAPSCPPLMLLMTTSMAIILQAHKQSCQELLGTECHSFARANSWIQER